MNEWVCADLVLRGYGTGWGTAQGWMADIWGIHRTKESGAPRWRVTHLPTGCWLDAFVTCEQAQAYVTAILPLTDWDAMTYEAPEPFGPEKQLLRWQLDEVCQRVRAEVA